MVDKSQLCLFTTLFLLLKLYLWSKPLNVKTDKLSLASIKENNLPRKFDYKKERKKTLNYLKKKVRKKYYLKLLNLEKFYVNKIIKKF